MRSAAPILVLAALAVALGAAVCALVPLLAELPATTAYDLGLAALAVLLMLAAVVIVKGADHA